MAIGRLEDAMSASEEGWVMLREGQHTRLDASALGAYASNAVLFGRALEAAERPADALAHYTATIDDLLPSLANHPARITGGVIALRDAAAALAEAQPEPPNALLDAIRRLDALCTSAAVP